MGTGVLATLSLLAGLVHLNPWTIWVIMLTGLSIGAQLMKRSYVSPIAPPSWWTILILPVIALLVVACCLPPGTIWRSEAHGYDVLSYHLQLPKEWLANGSIESLKHNVYSFLPGAMEAVYAQLGTNFHRSRASDLGVDLIAPVFAAQLVHAGMMLIAAYGVWALVRSKVGNGAAWISAGAMLGVPWVVVTGSSAYNEGLVLVGFIGALLALHANGMTVWRRGIVAGALAGIAVSAKLTAAYMVLPSLVIAGLALRPSREWMKVGLTAAGAGLVVCLPWLVRNWLACGNPVFPYLTEWFGTAHWTSEQVARWHDGHMLDLVFGDRVARLFSVEYGLRHPQWSIFAWLVVVASVPAVWCREQRRLALVMVGSIAVQVIAWLFIGHLQSRFLITLVVPGAVLIGLGLGMATVPHWKRLCEVLGVIAVLTLSEASVRRFLAERDGKPNIGLVGGVHALNGSMFAEMTPGELLELGPDATLNVMRGVFRDREPMQYSPIPLLAWRVYLLGDATPLYLANSEKAGEIVYHTTWDRELLGDAIRAYPDDPHQWVDALAARGITHVLVNVSELRRLRGSGWYDPDVSPEAALRLCERLEPVAVWPERGQGLYKLTEHEPESR